MQIDEALAALRRVTGHRARGWASPAVAESPHTLDLLAQSGIEYVGDWANDERPFPIQAGGRALWNVPFPHELSDATAIWQQHHSAGEFAQQVVDAYDVLVGEAAPGDGRLLAVALHPWISGQPHRIRALEAALTHVTRAGTWSATAADVLDAVRTPGTGSPSPQGAS